MAAFFLFGHLLDAALRDLVLGGAGTADHRAVRLNDHVAHTTALQRPIALHPAPGGQVEGLLISGLSDEQIARLRYYATVLGCGEVDVAPDGIPATAFAPATTTARDASEASGAPVSRDECVALARVAAVEIMAQYGRWPAQDFGAHRLKAVYTRAAARLRAPDRARSSQFVADRDIFVEAQTLPYMNFFSLSEIDVRYRRFDGDMGPVMNRAAINVGDAAIVLPYDPVRDCVLLVQQFRPATYLAGDTAPWIWEAPAGLVDPGETPQDAAYREAEEEAKVRLTRLEPVTRAYSSTGSSTEFSHIFIGIADLGEAGAVAGLEEEGEDIRSEVLSFAQFQADLTAGRFVNLQLVAAGLWLTLNRDRLRTSG